MTEVLLAMAVAAGCIASFLAGAKVGKPDRRGEKPGFPAEKREKRKESAGAEPTAQEKRMETILRNIEAYDGTAQGQETVEGVVEQWP